MQLSKSDYMLYLKHPAWLWLKKHDKEKLPAMDDNTQAMLDAGNIFESYAERRFPDGLRLGFTNPEEYQELADATKQILDEDVQTIFQGRFVAGDLTCIIDVLDRVEDNAFDLYEIKASSRPKPEHEYDLAFQVTVLEAAGYTIRNISVIHVNSSYMRDGDVDYEALTKMTDITVKVRERMGYTRAKIDEALELISQTERPDISPRHADLGGLPEWLTIYRSLATDLPPYSIYDLCSAKAKMLGELEDLGIRLISDIPDDFKLSPKQRLQLEVIRSGEPIIHNDKIKDFLKGLTYPLYFLDYETLTSIVPYFDGLRPYGQLPFQYSLHVLDEPGAELRQVGYLHRDETCPAEALTKSLREHLGDTGSVITWNMSFEKGCNKLMGEMLSDCFDFCDQLNGRVVDLMLPFSKNWYVHKDFAGSASIKKVLPVLVPELSYKTLGIQEGLGAQRLWMESVLDGKRQDEKEHILSDLDEYCGLDTLAMVKIHEKLAAL